MAWGNNTSGQTNVPASLTNAIAVAAGRSHSLAVRSDGTVVAWGYNDYGETNVPASLTNAIAVAAGYSHSLALRSDGTVVAWGYNTLGETNVPASLANAVAVAAGTGYSLALFSRIPTEVSLRASPASALLGPVAAGTSLDLLGSAVGTGPFSYQWEREGVALVGETNATLRFAALQLSQNGAAYRLRVANRFGVTTTSAPVVLSVQAFVVNADGIGLSTTNFVFDDSAVVGLASRFPNAAIFYTLDGSPPDFTANWYVGPFTVSNSVTLRAIAYSANWAEWDEAGPFYFTLQNHYYTLTATSPGGGTVSKNPPDGPYLNYTPVTVTATPNPGWTFLRWEGDAAGTNPVVSVNMNSNLTVRAIFRTQLGTTVAGNGTVTLDPPGGWYPHGSTVRLTGVPQPGSYFGFWGSAAQGNVNPLLFTVTNPSPAVSCIFGTLAANQAALTVQITGGSQVARAPVGNVFTLGQTVTLTATANGGQSFVGWGGDASSSQNPLPVVMDRSRVVSAYFQATNELVPPQIVQQPASVAARVGTSASFTVLAKGAWPLAYHWRKAGTPLAGATDLTFALPAVSESDAGSYTVVVTNSLGAFTSAVATLTVTLPGHITSIAPQPGGTIFLEATGAAGRPMIFFTSSNLFDWLPWLQLPNPSGTVQVLDPAALPPRKFYRVESR